MILDSKGHQDTPIGPAEAQFDGIAQGDRTEELDSPAWYESISWRNSILSREKRVKLIALNISFCSYIKNRIL